MKRKALSKAFIVDHTQMSDQVDHLRNLLLFYKALKTFKKKVDQ
jgi:4-hydroxyphenylpyruvate dioxygenase-like putative hemolysin